MSQDNLLSCRRAVAYAATGAAQSDPEPNRATSANEMRQALREITMNAMSREGWDLGRVRTRDRLRDSYSISLPYPNLKVIGQPDAIGVHPEMTGGKHAVIMTNSGPQPWDTRRIEAPLALHQGFALTPEEQNNPAFIAWLDNRDGELNLETVTPDRMAAAWDEACARLGVLSGMFGRDGSIHIPRGDSRTRTKSAGSAPGGAGAGQKERRNDQGKIRRGGQALPGRPGGTAQPPG